MYAIISDRNRQYLVREGDRILIHRAGAGEGEEMRFDQVLCLDGETGTPFVVGACVSGIVRGNVRGRKIFVGKYRRRKNYRRRTGSRQTYTQVEITGITSNRN